jgi:hypothetical protein
VVQYCLMFEKMGIPTAPVVTATFSTVVKKVAFELGMPNLRYTFTPHPIAGLDLETSRKYLRGNDPQSNKPIISECAEALTKPLSDDDKKTGVKELPHERLLKPDTQENLEQLFLDNYWTDFMTFTLPTEERVAEMLKGTSHAPGEIVGRMQASGPHPMYTFTVEMVAACAVMAGCKPIYLPVVLAIASTGATSLFTSTTSFSRMVVVNGPIRQEIGMYSGIGALGPFNHANAAIGRTWTILSRCLSRSGLPGQNYMGSIGNPLSYNNLCFPEKEEALPEGWNPLHVQRGFKREESAVSIFSGYGMTHADTNFNMPLHEQIPYYLRFNNPDAGAVMVMDPTAANRLKAEGFNTKEKVIEYAWENTKISVDDYWSKYQLVEIFIRPRAEKGVEPFASWLKLPPGTLIPQFPSKGMINIVVLGGETQEFWQLGDHTFVASTSVDTWR